MKNLTNMTDDATRELNGGYRYFCKVCGLQSNSQWTVFKHIATRHIGAWTTNLYHLIVRK